MTDGNAGYQPSYSQSQHVSSDLEFSSVRQSSTPHRTIGTGRWRRISGSEFIVEDLVTILELGRGNGGVVHKVRNKALRANSQLMVRKTFDLDLRTAVRAQILRDVQILKECISPYIVEMRGAFHSESSLNLCFEYMDAGSLDTLLPMAGRFPEPIIVLVAQSMLEGLLYLWQEHRLVHRNLKPSNVLISRTTGAVKLSDFVVSNQLVESFANAFVATRTYMAPECLLGSESVNGLASDIWSFGLTLMELAIGHYPIPAVDPVDFVRAFAPDRQSNMAEHFRASRLGEPLSALEGSSTSPLGVFDLFARVVEHPAPRLAAYCFSAGFIQLVHACVQTDPVNRLSLSILHKRIIPSLLLSQANEFEQYLSSPINTHYSRISEDFDLIEQPQQISIVGYLRGIFAHQQEIALDAVELAVDGEFATAGDSIVIDVPDVGIVPTIST